MYKRDLVENILRLVHLVISKFFFISVIVLLSDFLKGQLSLLCEGNSAESFTKRIGSE